MVLFLFFIIGSSVYRGALNYLILNGWLSILLVFGILISNSIFLILAIYGKIGYYPFFLLLAFLYHCSSFKFILLDLVNKITYFASFVIIFNLSMYFSTFDLWLLLFNLIVSLFFIKFMVSIKHAIFLSSFIQFLLVYHLLLFEDFLYILSALLFYSLFNINAIITLLITKQSKFQLAFLFVDLVNFKLYAQLLYILLVFNWLVAFAFYPFVMLISKLCGLGMICCQSVSLFAFLALFLLFVYQSLVIRALFGLLPLLCLLFVSYAFIILSLIALLAELNRVPFDLPEGESELVAGFITEYSSIYFSIVLLTEYANVIGAMLLVIILFSLILSLSIFLLLMVCLVRSTLNRLKFDELMTHC